MTVVQLLIGLATLVVNAFFVGAEFALISVRRSQIEPYAEQGDRRAKSVLWGLEHVSALMAAAQLGITLCTLILGVVAEPAIAHLLEPVFHAVGVPKGAGHAVSFVIALTLATYLHMLLGEMVPKNIALAEPVRSALLLGPPLVTLARGLRPVIFAVNAFANALLKLLRVETKDEVTATFSDAELARIVRDSGEAGLIDERARERLHDALELGRRPVRDVVLPLEGVVYARVGVTPEQLEALSNETGFSRFPVVDEGRRIVGYLHIKDALDASPRDLPFPVRDMRPIARIRESTPLDDVLTAMRRSRTHLAAVLGTDGRLAGLVTMEDVLRELFGRQV
ncbi:CBS domain containing-hemolysin-like protein [Streptomyces sp. SAI-135]|jgi:CBS domain containing-hemolysin-like protein|uniref:hemolysin family protein n=1 Tax=unclassified Streptomyces TaxID=2593676 RepID=UPI002475E61C|nr:MULTISPECIES: hemolysin family protein [unclassified Streptomyces]MDH6520652.1 CBS domain containing-hemolysin-like protein [Streptomyces sp. SAI-090]MDH6552870.1 CBS domain containing-hemolysin-like protein [Streptomyces sp. SAI-041]MDH6571956.1 CBS domain containing-hemolysin-like protein [Streptomyces sp. SAI-117]MDH6583086.1 CBS domain containing-hemolysin-like protein [Streptomyces sp. SAI-133]MDH6615257.1 CBS domain containing-hemolysin-like protein [Streptomyces sp. SAI-135]